MLGAPSGAPLPFGGFVTYLKYPVLFNEPGGANTTQFGGLPIGAELLSNYFLFNPFQQIGEFALPATALPSDTPGSPNNGWVEIVNVDGGSLSPAAFVKGEPASLWTRQDTGNSGIADGFWAYTSSYLPRIHVHSGKGSVDPPEPITGLSGTQAQHDHFFGFHGAARNFLSAHVAWGHTPELMDEAESFFGVATTASQDITNGASVFTGGKEGTISAIAVDGEVTLSAEISLRVSTAKTVMDVVYISGLEGMTYDDGSGGTGDINDNFWYARSATAVGVSPVKFELRTYTGNKAVTVSGSLAGSPIVTIPIRDYIGFHKPANPSKEAATRKLYFCVGESNKTTTFSSQTYIDTGMIMASNVINSLAWLNDYNGTIYAYASIKSGVEPRLCATVSGETVPTQYEDSMRPTIANSKSEDTIDQSRLDIFNFLIGMGMSLGNYSTPKF